MVSQNQVTAFLLRNFSGSAQILGSRKLTWCFWPGALAFSHPCSFLHSEELRSFPTMDCWLSHLLFCTKCLLYFKYSRLPSHWLKSYAVFNAQATYHFFPWNFPDISWKPTSLAQEPMACSSCHFRMLYSRTRKRPWPKYVKDKCWMNVLCIVWWKCIHTHIYISNISKSKW